MAPTWSNVKISVIIPCYNSAEYISDCIASIMKQSLPVYEIIIVDDGSTDDTVAIAQSLGNPIHVVKQPNLGVSIARNVGVSHSQGDLIAFMDADDLWEPEKVKLQTDYLLEHVDAVAVVSGFKIFGAGFKTMDCQIADEVLLHSQPIDFLAFPLIFPSVMLVRASVAKLVSFPADVRDGEDLIYAAQLRALGPIGSAGGLLAYRRQHSEQVTKSAHYFTKNFKARLAWAKNNHAKIHIESVDFAESQMFAGAVKNVMSSYWMRDFKRFKSLRQELLHLWPEEIPVSAELKRYVPPLTLIKFKDIIDSVLKRLRMRR